MISYQQKADHTCGAACVQSVMGKFGRKVPSERTLARKLKAKFATGIEPWAIVDYLQGAGLQAEYKQEKNLATLYRRLDVTSPPLAIVCWADWGGHWCVIINHGRINDEIRLILADPAASYDFRPDGFTHVSGERFKSMWYTPGKKRRHEVIYVTEAIA